MSSDIPPPQPAPPPSAVPPPLVQPAPVADPAPPRSPNAAVVVGVAIVVVLVILAGALFALFSTLAPLLGGEGSGGDGSGGDAPPSASQPDPPCAGCLSATAATSLRIPDGIPALGLEFDDDAGYAKPSIVGAYADNSSQTYLDGAGSPAGCSFAVDYAPVSATNPDESDRTDRVIDLGSFVSDSDYLSQVARVFANEGDAANYPAALRASIDGCPQYSFDLGGGDERWSTDVVPLEVDTGSPDVTAVGWAEQSGDYRLMIVDVQYANLAVRTIYNQSLESSAGEDEFRTFIVEFASRLAALGS